MATQSYDGSDQFYRYLFDAAPDVMMLVDKRGAIHVANSRFHDLLGYADGDLKRFQDLLPDEHRSGVEVMLTGVSEGTQMPEAEVDVLPASGRAIPMMIDVRQAGDEAHFLLRLRDLREIRTLEREYRNLFESIADAVLIGDPDSGQIYQVNRQACELTGYAHGEMIGTDYDGIHDVPWEAVRNELESSGHELSGREMGIVTNLGKRVPVEVYIRIVSREDDPIYIESAIDISQRKALEKRMQELRNEWDSFIRHELRSPLTPILAFSQILMEDFTEVQQSEKVMQYLEAIWQGGKRLERLLDLTREISQYEHGEIPLTRFQTDVIQTVRDAVNEAALGVGEEGGQALDRAHIVLPEGLADGVEIPISHDVQKIQRAVGNLVKNALEHDDGDVTVRLEADEQTVMVSVHNWGEPIPEDRLNTIFEKFNTTKRGKKGTGLGTTIARLFVEAHGGTVEAASSAEAGTTFTITLPRLFDGGK